MMSGNYGRYNDEQEPRKPSALNIILGLVMILVYLGMSYILLFTPLFDLTNTMRYVMGGVFALYGLFRGYRLFIGIK